ncbi:MAG: SgcJ/EcaC family oxidoreductase [Longimicrobiales bacterium]|nr:SgcJ/EcaC family oxidoreductase [Longimicrobiales bacterium]
MTSSRILPLLLLATACAPAPAAFTDAQRDAAAAEVRAASLALVDALNAHDADSILTFYSLDDDFTQVACTGFVFGGKGFAGLTRSLHANYRDAVYDMSVVSARVLGPDAAVVSLRGTMLAPLFVTRVLRRGETGRWLVAWEHESWPGCPNPTTSHAGAMAGDSVIAGSRGENP